MYLYSEIKTHSLTQSHISIHTDDDLDDPDDPDDYDDCDDHDGIL